MPYGVSERMVENYGEVIWDLSLNIQRRRGDAQGRSEAGHSSPSR